MKIWSSKYVLYDLALSLHTLLDLKQLLYEVITFDAWVLSAEDTCIKIHLLLYFLNKHSNWDEQLIGFIKLLHVMVSYYLSLGYITLKVIR